VAPDVDELFDEFAARWARGEWPDVNKYLERADAARDELAALLDAFLAHAAPPEPDEDTVAAFAAWRRGEGPLLELRRRRGLRVDDVVDELAATLGVAKEKRPKLKRYYQQLENGLLDVARVDPRVFSALARRLGETVSQWAALRPAPPAEALYLREADQSAVFARAPVAAPAEEPDEVDALFNRSSGPFKDR
jgi:hypothetical protein